MRIAIVVDGRTVLMRSCTTCSRRWWTADGMAVDPTDVLGRRTA